jgi:N-acetylglucosaminyldiphosphoundecaprenol N-acetyl-beta-D-mannosaminyltransferase
MRTDASLDHDVRSSDIISIDGKGILWAARLFGLALPGRVAGIDLMDSLLKLCADKGYRPYFLGATKDILAKAIERIQASYPQIQFAGWQDGYYSADKEAAVVENIRLSRADCLFVAMPTPKKEQFIANHHSELHVPFIMGVGGSLDVVAGFVRRAPKWVQELGLEWLYRTIQEPRRLAPRYFKTNAAFAWIMIRWMFDKHLMSYRLSRR